MNHLNKSVPQINPAPVPSASECYARLMDEDAECDFCGNTLEASFERVNRVCRACLEEQEREAKLAAFDDMVAVCRAMLRKAPKFARDMRAEHIGELDHLTRQIRSVFCRARIS